MTLMGWMVYALIVSTLLSVAARLLELALSRLRLPTRFVWIAALALFVGLPVTSAVTEPEPPTSMASAPPVGAADVVEGATIAPAAREPGLFDSLRELLSSCMHSAAGWISDAATLASGAPASLERAAAALWGASSLLLGLLALASMLRLKRCIRRWPVERVLGREVCLSPALGPATVGPLQPRIVLPRWARRMPEDELEMVLAHEEEHMRTRDPLLLVTGVALTVVCPWNPLAWWSARRLKDAVEVDCDRRVLRRSRSGDAARYGQLLVDLGSRGASGWLPVPTMTGSRSLLLRRLTMMKKMKPRSAIPTAVMATICAGGLLTVACTSEAPIATESVGSPESAESTAPASALESDVVSLRMEEADGPAYVDGVPIAPLQVAEHLAAEHPGDRSGMEVSFYVAPSVPYRSASQLSREIQEAGISRVTFESGDPGERLALVLPEAGERVNVNSRNVLQLAVQPSGAVEVRRGEDPRIQVVQPEDVTSIWRAGVAVNPKLIAAVRTHPDAAHSLTLEVLDALYEGEATRISLQPMEVPSPGR